MPTRAARQLKSFLEGSAFHDAADHKAVRSTVVNSTDGTSVSITSYWAALVSSIQKRVARKTGATFLQEVGERVGSRAPRCCVSTH